MKVGGLVSFELAGYQLIELAKAIIRGWLTAIGQVLTNDEVRLVGIDIARVTA